MYFIPQKSGTKYIQYKNTMMCHHIFISSYIKLFLRKQHEKKQQRISMSNFMIWLPNSSVG